MSKPGGHRVSIARGSHGYAAISGTSNIARGFGALVNGQSAPPLPGNRKPGLVPGFFVPAISLFDVRFQALPPLLDTLNVRNNAEGGAP